MNEAQRRVGVELPAKATGSSFFLDCLAAAIIGLAKKPSLLTGFFGSR